MTSPFESKIFPNNTIQTHREVKELATNPSTGPWSSGQGGTIEVWGDGTAIRAYTYVSDMVDGIYMLMHSELEGPVNIGSSQYVTVDELVEAVIEVAGKEIHKKYVEGPVGVQARNFSKARIYSLGWEAKVLLKEGISLTYPWIEEQVKTARQAE